MKYQGGKSRIAKRLCKYIDSILTPEMNFYDLFCGACNIVAGISGTEKRYANDIFTPIIATMKACAEGYEFPDDWVTKEEYLNIRNNDVYPENHPLHAFYLIGCAYAGIYKQGYAKAFEKGKWTNFAYRAKIGLDKKRPKLQNVIWSNKPYDEVDILPNSLIYCDIPYHGTSRINGLSFDHDKFYSWVAKQTSIVLISEYKDSYNPLNLPTVWQKEYHSYVNKKRPSKTVEVIRRYN